MKRILLSILSGFVVLSCSPSSDLVVEEPKAEEPSSKPEPTPLPSVDFESSYEAVANMGVGWNLGNTLESVWTGDTDGRDWKTWETGWGQVVTTPALINMIRDAGFGAIRVPVSWGVHMDSDGKVYDEWMNRVQQVVNYVIDAGLYCIINVHHDTGADEKLAWLVASPQVYERERTRYEGLWKQIAERFRDYDHHLLFESFNEMLDSERSWCFASFNVDYDSELAAGAYEAINDYAQSFVDVVRSTGGNNAVRNLVVNTYASSDGGGDWSPYLKDPLKNMKMPSDKVKDHVIFQVHSYPSIDDIPAMETHVSSVLDALEMYLEPLGGPVIVGEWGTFSEDSPLENYCHYAEFFVSEAKKRGIGTFHWMGLSDGIFRSIPCFNEPEKTKAILKGYHGSDFVSVIPAVDDFVLEYVVTWYGIWSEVNLCSSDIDVSEYAGIMFELDKVPASGSLHVKVYGEEDGMEQYYGFRGSSVSIDFDPSVLGSKVRRVTLQKTVEEEMEMTLTRVALIRKDGTQEECVPSVFWGCSVNLIAS